MIGDEFDTLRAADPVDIRTVRRAVAPHRSALEATIGADLPARRRALWSRQNDSRSTRSASDSGAEQTSFGLILGLAAAAVALVFPLSIVTTSGSPRNIEIVETPAGSLDVDDGTNSGTDGRTDSTTDDPQAPASTEPADPTDGLFTPTVTTPDPDDRETTPTTNSDPITSTTIATASDSDQTEPGPSSSPVESDAVPASESAPPLPTDPSSDPASTPASPPVLAPTSESTPAPKPSTSDVSTNDSPSVETTQPAEPAPVPPSDESAAAPTPPPVASPAPVASVPGPFDPAADLLVVTFDFAHRDDGHAAVATRELADHFGLDPLVIAGTAAPTSTRYHHDHVAMMNAAWDTGWYDARSNRAAAVDHAATRWLATLDAGGEIWIGEGGVSDFTADVVRAILDLRPGVDMASSVHLVQHSQRNAEETRTGDLDVLASHVDLIDIDDGNDANGSADLNGASDSFEAIAQQGSHAARWTAAFDYHSVDSLDFSDTVTVLFPLGIDLGTVADVDDFARFVIARDP